MPVVVLRPPLAALAGGRGEVEAEGATIHEILRNLERSYPRLAGWVLDEQGSIRRHVGVFLDGERVEATAVVRPHDRVQVLPAISGGAASEVLVGTKKGLVVLRGERGGPMAVAVRAFPGQVVEYAVRDDRTGTYYASVTHGQFGPRVLMAEDPLGEWEQAVGPAFPEDAGASVERIWVIQPGVEPGVLWAGVDPAALFRSDDGGRTWSLNRGLWDHPTRPDWQPGFGGLALHSICPWPEDPARLAVGVSAAGVWRSADGGQTWSSSNTGLVPRYLPEDAREDTLALCVHNMHRSSLEPATMYLQFHGGVYRSDDAGSSWSDIADGLPSDFGFPMVIDPRDPDRAFVIPLVADLDRVTPEGRVRVYGTADRGGEWSALESGLPQRDAYLTILRQAFGHDGRDPLGMYFGATSGEVFGSVDGGGTWKSVARRLPPVTSVRPTS